MQDCKHAGRVAVTGERSSAAEAALVAALAAGLHVAHASEDEPWTVFICMSCGAALQVRWPPSDARLLRQLSAFVREHGMHDVGVEDM